MCTRTPWWPTWHPEEAGHANRATTSFNLGNSGDLPITGDWQGTGKTEAGLYRPSNANFYLDETSGIVNFQYGNGGTWS